MIAFNGVTINPVTVLVWLVIALISGAVAEALMGYTHIGLISATAIGLLGALLGTWVAHPPPSPAAADDHHLWGAGRNHLVYRRHCTAHFRPTGHTFPPWRRLSPAAALSAGVLEQ